MGEYFTESFVWAKAVDANNTQAKNRIFFIVIFLFTAKVINNIETSKLNFKMYS